MFAPPATCSDLQVFLWFVDPNTLRPSRDLPFFTALSDVLFVMGHLAPHVICTSHLTGVHFFCNFRFFMCRALLGHLPQFSLLSPPSMTCSLRLTCSLLCGPQFLESFTSHQYLQFTVLLVAFSSCYFLQSTVLLVSCCSSFDVKSSSCDLQCFVQLAVFLCGLQCSVRVGRASESSVEPCN